MRALTYVLILAALLAGCATVTNLRNAKTGQTAKCGGGIWTFNSAGQYDRCIKYFHQLGFDPVP